MKGRKILAALAARKNALSELKGQEQPDGTLYVSNVGTFHVPGSVNSRKGYAGKATKAKHKAPQGGGSPSRVARRQGTKAATRKLVQGRTRGAASAARRAVRVRSGQGDTGELS
jgi:hypothetical protein